MRRAAHRRSLDGKPHRDARLHSLSVAAVGAAVLLRPGLPASYQIIINGTVLLIAAGVDALSRRRSARR